MISILICGYGNIGKHLYKELEPLEDKEIATIDIYDKYKNAEINEDFPDTDKHYDFMFVCVPTEMNEDGSANISEVVDCINTFTGADTIVIKSTLPITTWELQIKKSNVVISPEYWGTTQHCPEPNFLILGGYQDYTNKVVQLYNKLKDGYYKYYLTDHRTAELVKYMENCWIAAKVTFCNEFANIAKSFSVSYTELRELWLADTRVSPSHTLVYDDKPYYDSHCLNKDIPALLSFCKNNKVETPFMESIFQINKKAKGD